MANIVFNVALGRLATYADLGGGANDALIMVPLEATGLVTDATMRDYDTLAAVLAGASNEQTSNMTRKTLASVTVGVDDTNDRVNIDCADVTWTAATGNAIGAVLICYDPDTTGGDDTTIIPLTKHDVTMTPDGSDFTLTISDFARASSAA
jgi:ABC-type transport system substrate-binding protein